MRFLSLKLLAFALTLAIVDQYAFAADVPDAASILEESYRVSRHLSEPNRAFFLVRLVDISTNISPDRTEAWALELFDLAHKMPADWNRIATQKNALVPLSRVNPTFAFHLLFQVEKPIASAQGLTEDVRADAAAIIFPNYLKAVGAKGLSEITKSADSMGKTGEYPYRAMGLIIANISKNPDLTVAADNIFKKASNYYGRGSAAGFTDEDSQFFELLKSSESVVSASEYQAALRRFAQSLISEPSVASQDPEGNRVSLAAVRTAGGEFRFSNEKDALLFRLFPVIARQDRELAAKLLEQRPVLQYADVEVGRALASVIQKDPNAQAKAFTEEVEQQLLLRKVRYFQEEEPETAYKEAQNLANPIAKIEEMSAALISMARFNPEQSRLAYAQVADAVDLLPEGKQKLRTLVALAKAAYFVRGSGEFLSLSSKAVVSGVQIFSKSSEAITLSHPGCKELLDLAEFGAEHDSEWILGRIRSLEDEGLRAYMLLYASRGLGKAQRIAY